MNNESKNIINNKFQSNLPNNSSIMPENYSLDNETLNKVYFESNKADNEAEFHSNFNDFIMDKVFDLNKLNDADDTISDNTYC